MLSNYLNATLALVPSEMLSRQRGVSTGDYVGRYMQVSLYECEGVYASGVNVQ